MKETSNQINKYLILSYYFVWLLILKQNIINKFPLKHFVNFKAFFAR